MFVTLAMFVALADVCHIGHAVMRRAPCMSSAAMQPPGSHATTTQEILPWDQPEAPTCGHPTGFLPITSATRCITHEEPSMVDVTFHMYIRAHVGQKVTHCHVNQKDVP